MTITSAGRFTLEGTKATVKDPAVTETCIILTGFQDKKSSWWSWSGFLGVSGRVPGICFDFESPRSGDGASVGYFIIEP